MTTATDMLLGLHECFPVFPRAVFPLLRNILALMRDEKLP